MYNELFIAWQREIAEVALGDLPSDFYTRIAAYLKKIKEENQNQDKRSVKVTLLGHEAQNVKRMLEELLSERYKKIFKIISKNQKVPLELLTVEEAKMSESFLTSVEIYQDFCEELLQGQIVSQDNSEVSNKRVSLRFTNSIPAVIGADMKTYGPFMVEDVASLPVENAKILVKQGLAVVVEAL
jgi:DNA replication initiation complex subunit (GINS family)